MPFLGSMHFPSPQSQGGLRHLPHPPPPAGSLYYKHWICQSGGWGVEGSPAPAPFQRMYIVYRGVHTWLVWPQHPHFPQLGRDVGILFQTSFLQ